MNAPFIPAVVARQDTADFHLKATHALAKRGIFRKDVIAETLGIAGRTARRLRNTPCPDHFREMVEVHRRKQIEATNRNAAPFILDFVNGEEAVDRWRSNGLRENVRDLLADGLSQSEVARVLDRSRQIISYHAKVLKEAGLIQP